MRPITERENQVLLFINTYAAWAGYPPSRKEIQSHFGFASPNAAQQFIKSLAKKGAIIKRDGIARGITVLNQAEA